MTQICIIYCQSKNVDVFVRGMKVLGFIVGETMVDLGASLSKANLKSVSDLQYSTVHALAHTELNVLCTNFSIKIIRVKFYIMCCQSHLQLERKL